MYNTAGLLACCKAEHVGPAAQRQTRAQAEADRQEYEDKKLKMRKAMGEDLHKAVPGEPEDSRQRRLNLIRCASLLLRAARMPLQAIPGMT